MRDRAWRRYIEQKIVERRLSMLIHTSSSWWRFYNLNGSHTNQPVITDFLGQKENYNFKTFTTDRWTSKHKVKYSPNSSKSYWRDEGKYKQTREFNKKCFLQILKENGLK